MIQFDVHGQPATQGSKKTVPIYKNGKPIIKDGRVLAKTVEDNPKLSQWRQQVAEAALAAYDGEPLVGPIRLVLLFHRPRPKGHYGTGKNIRVLKPSAPAFPITTPDTIKLARAVEDALKGIVYRDDSQVVDHELKKRYGPSHRVVVSVTSLDGLTREPDSSNS